MAPSAMIVTPEAPVNAVKNAQAASDTSASPPRHPAEQRIGQPHETTWRIALAEQVSGESEKRNRGQEWQIGNTQNLERDIHQIGIVALKTQHGAGSDDRKQRSAENSQQRENDGERNHCGALLLMPVAIWKTSRTTDTAKR